MSLSVPSERLCAAVGRIGPAEGIYFTSQLVCVNSAAASLMMRRHDEAWFKKMEILSQGRFVFWTSCRRGSAEGLCGEEFKLSQNQNRTLFTAQAGEDPSASRYREKNVCWVFMNVVFSELFLLESWSSSRSLSISVFTTRQRWCYFTLCCTAGPSKQGVALLKCADRLIQIPCMITGHTHTHKCAVTDNRSFY